MKIRLTGPQEGALECRGLDEPFDAGEALLARCWVGRYLRFEADQRDALFSVLNELSNAEDAQHQIEGDALAGRAARSLAALASRVLKS